MEHAADELEAMSPDEALEELKRESATSAAAMTEPGEMPEKSAANSASNEKENGTAIAEVRKNLAWDAAGKASLKSEALDALQQAAPAEQPKKGSFWQKAGAALSKLNFWSKKKEEPYDEIAMIQKRRDTYTESRRKPGETMPSDAEIAEDEVRDTFEKATDRMELGLSDGTEAKFSEKEQGDILEYANAHPELKRTKSIELLALLPRLSEKRKEVLTAMVLESIGDAIIRENIFNMAASGKKSLDQEKKERDFEFFLTTALKNATDDRNIENILPLIPFADIERIAKKISGEDYRLVTPQEFEKALSGGRPKAR